MAKKRLLLTALSVALLTGFFFLPENREWLKKVMGYGEDMFGQAKRLDESARFTKRFGKDYTYSISIAANMRKNKQQDALLLMPPTLYFTKRGITYHVPEPAVFYYFTGIKTVWANSHKAIKADLYVHVKDGKILLASGDNKAALNDTILSFRQYPVEL